jgi:uncharacterized membrane protein YfcA
MDILLVILFGIAGGFVGGLVGVGGGILFVPALALFLDEPQVRAEATSLLAIVIVAIAGTWRQHRYGNVRLGDAAIIGALSLVGVGIGVVVSNEVSERTLEVGFAVLALGIAAQLVHRASRRAPDEP